MTGEEDASELAAIVGSSLRAIRVTRGLSQEQLAAQVGMHRTMVGAIERGSRNLTLRSVERLAHRLGVPVADLFGLAEDT